MEKAKTGKNKAGQDNAGRDIKSLKESPEALKRLETMLAAINEMASKLLSHERESLVDVMSYSMKPIADAAGLKRIAVYRYLDMHTQFSQVYLWIGRTVPLEDFMIMIPSDDVVTRWMQTWIKNECINANLKYSPDDEVEWLGKFGIKSIYMVPVFTEGKLWGVITFEDHTKFRYFDEGSLDLLQSAAHICAGAVMRDEMKRKIHESGHAGEALEQMPEAVSLGALKLDLLSHRAFINDDDLNLTEKEFTLIRLFVHFEGRVINAETLYKKIWGQPMLKDKNALQVTVTRLRKKIEPAGYSIVSVRGKGYRFEKE